MSHLITPKEEKHFLLALKAQCPINALIGRVIVTQIIEEDEKVDNIQIEGSIPGFGETMQLVKVGSILMPKAAKEKLKDDNETVKAIVKSIGINQDPNYDLGLKINDLVYVFPSVFETKWKFGEIDYFSYSMRDLVACENKDVKGTVVKTTRAKRK